MYLVKLLDISKTILSVHPRLTKSYFLPLLKNNDKKDFKNFKKERHLISAWCVRDVSHVFCANLYRIYTGTHAKDDSYTLQNN